MLTSDLLFEVIAITSQYLFDDPDGALSQANRYSPSQIGAGRASQFDSAPVLPE
jgi:hypothetical protein